MPIFSRDAHINANIGVYDRVYVKIYSYGIYGIYGMYVRICRICRI